MVVLILAIAFTGVAMAANGHQYGTNKNYQSMGEPLWGESVCIFDEHGQVLNGDDVFKTTWDTAECKTGFAWATCDGASFVKCAGNEANTR